ncbi:MAG: hypothetical protein MUO18_03675 [Methanomassiliicoccales archaeon]|jgi:hypothetical protein|nr:hypothetical protein [Methanomassiliicoccales archaeon]
MPSDDIPDVEKLRELFKVLSDSVPQLLENVTKVLYEAKSGEEFGKAVAGFYQAMVSAGMSKEQAFALTKEYMSNLSIGGMLKGIAGGAVGSRGEDSDLG